MSTQQYSIFDGEETLYRKKKTSNKNVRDIFQVLCQTAGRSIEEKKYYALHGGIEPKEVSKNEQGERVFSYSFNTVYDRHTMYAALAEKLFYGAPKLGDIDLETGLYTVSDTDLFDDLIRNEVRRAFDDFVGECGMRLWMEENTSETHGASPIFQNAISELIRKMDQGNTKEQKQSTKES